MIRLLQLYLWRCCISEITFPRLVDSCLDHHLSRQVNHWVNHEAGSTAKSTVLRYVKHHIYYFLNRYMLFNLGYTKLWETLISLH